MRQLHTVIAAALLVVLLSTAATPVTATTRVTKRANTTAGTGASASAAPWGVTIDSTGALMDIPARKMWGWGPGLHGYCGSMSFQMAGLFNGNYVSQERVRYAGGDSEILIGSGNEVTAAKALSYDYSEWKWRKEDVPQSKKFLDWSREQVDQGHVVITGWYERQPKGDEDYDHIMPIVGYKLKNDKVDGLYHYDLYLNYKSLTAGDDLHATRKECKQNQSPVQPFDYCLPDDYDYAISVHGVKDEKNELFRMKLVAPDWWEPDYGKEDGLHQTPVDFIFQAVVTGLTKGSTYTILRFDSPGSVPSKNFKDGSYGNHKTFTATDSTMTLDMDPVASDGTWFYRTIAGSV